MGSIFAKISRYLSFSGEVLSRSLRRAFESFPWPLYSIATSEELHAAINIWDLKPRREYASLPVGRALLGTDPCISRSVSSLNGTFSSCAERTRVNEFSFSPRVPDAEWQQSNTTVYMKAWVKNEKNAGKSQQVLTILLPFFAAISSIKMLIVWSGIGSTPLGCSSVRAPQSYGRMTSI